MFQNIAVTSFIPSIVKTKQIETGRMTSTFVVFHRNVTGSSHLNINVGNGSYCQTLMDEGCKIKENYHHESMSVILGLGSLAILRFYK